MKCSYYYYYYIFELKQFLSAISFDYLFTLVTPYEGAEVAHQHFPFNFVLSNLFQLFFILSMSVPNYRCNELFNLLLFRSPYGLQVGFCLMVQFDNYRNFRSTSNVIFYFPLHLEAILFSSTVDYC